MAISEHGIHFEKFLSRETQSFNIRFIGKTRGRICISLFTERLVSLE